MTAIRLDSLQRAYEAAEFNAATNDLSLALVTRSLAEESREWSEPMQFRIVDDELHPGIVVIELRRPVEEAA